MNAMKKLLGLATNVLGQRAPRRYGGEQYRRPGERPSASVPVRHLQKLLVHRLVQRREHRRHVLQPRSPACGLRDHPLRPRRPELMKPSARSGTSAPSIGACGASRGGRVGGQCLSPRPPGFRHVASSSRAYLGAVLAYSAACLGTVGCEADPVEISHPTPDNIPVGGPVVGTSPIPTGLEGDELEDWVDARDALRRSAMVVTIGKLGEVGDDETDIFGWVADAKFDADGNVVVLDRMARDVRVFDVAGRFLTEFGGNGDGPGEFRDPFGLAILSGGRIVVADRRGRLEVFAKKDGGYVYAGPHPLPADLRVRDGLCHTAGRLFLSVWEPESNAVIHEVPLLPEGVAKTFGRGYRAHYPLVQQLLTDGPIGCLGDPLQVVFAFQQLPVLRAYSADSGTELWTALVADYVQGQIVENRATGSVGYLSGLKDIAMAATGMWGRHILYQTGRGERAAPDEAEIRSYLLDAASGNGALVSTSLPFVSDVTDTHLLGYWVTGVPRVEVRRLAPRSE